MKRSSLASYRDVDVKVVMKKSSLPDLHFTSAEISFIMMIVKSISLSNNYYYVPVDSISLQFTFGKMREHRLTALTLSVDDLEHVWMCGARIQLHSCCFRPVDGSRVVQ